MIDVATGTIVVYADIACPWATLAVHRLCRARERLGLLGRVGFDLRAFPLELVNDRPTPKRTLDAEVPVVGGLDESLGWQVWQDDASRWPVTTLLALEAVQVAKEQSVHASEELDRALRRALFVESRCISMRHVILDVAGECEHVDAPALAHALDDGRARRRVIEQWKVAEGEDVQGSPHLFLADGSNEANPGIEMHWSGEHGKGFPIVTKDRPQIYDDLLERAAQA